MGNLDFFLTALQAEEIKPGEIISELKTFLNSHLKTTFFSVISQPLGGGGFKTWHLKTPKRKTVI